MARDGFDKTYERGRNIRILWAAGKMMGDVQMKHFTNDRGIVDAILSNDFELGCFNEFLQLN